ncbi:transcriptional regulator TbsP [Halobellus rubicundus]|uniref:Transcriptional regulator TbsP n=1 Tax=Halobellus rubicundus TaxID=2996466 RepID=A0ABD5MDW5_9EURY
MSPASNVLGDSVEHVLSSSLRAASGPVYVIGPSDAVVESLVEFAVGADAPPELRVLAGESQLKSVMGDFLVASHASDLVASGSLDLRSTAEGTSNTLLVTESSVVAVVAAGDSVAGLTTDDESFVESAHEAYRERFEDAEAFRLRTPALSEVRSSLEDDLGGDVRDEFDGVLDSLQSVDGADGIDEVTISLLVAARNEVLLYDVSKWGEDVGIASKATFSRTKSDLEERGLIETEKVPIDVGRPRLRLRLADERLADADLDELAAVARDLLN